MLGRIKKCIAWWNRPNKSYLADWIQTLVLILPLAFIIRTWGYGLYQVPSGSMETTMLIGERFLADKFSYIFWKPQRGDIISFNDPTFKYSKKPLKNLIERYIWIPWSSSGPENWTKRLIGLPGDHVEGKIEDGKPAVYLNGTKLDEPYLNKYVLVPISHHWHYRSFDLSKSFEDQLFYKLNAMKVRQLQKIFSEMGVPTELVPEHSLDSYGLTKGSDVFDVYLGENEYWGMGDNRLGSYDSRGWGKLDGKLIHGKIVFRLLSIDTSDTWVIFDLLAHPIEFWSRVRWSRWFQRVR